MLISIYVRSAVAASLRTARARTTYSITTQLSLTYRTLCGLRMIPRISAGSWALPARLRALATTVLLTVRTLVMPTLPLRMASYRAITTDIRNRPSAPQSSRLAIQARYHSQHSRNCAMGYYASAVYSVSVRIQREWDCAGLQVRFFWEEKFSS